MKAKDVSKLTKEEAVKKVGELSRSMLELEPFSPKKKTIKKSIARLHTHIGNMPKVSAKPVGK